MTETSVAVIGENEYLAWLCNRKGLFRGGIKKLLRVFGSAEDVYRHRFDQVETVLESDYYKKINWKMTVEENMAELKRHGIVFLSQDSSDYPPVLAELADAPLGLFVRGRREYLGREAVGIVGARLCSAYGRETAMRLGRQLAESGLTVISGMAAGIDRAAHVGALEGGGVTVAVLGCGLLRCYPNENRDIYQRLGQTACLLSEYPLDQEPYAFCFPERNRLIAALCRQLVIVEARGAKSGAMITVDRALELGRDVYAVPGSIWSPLSRGVHNLINQGAMLLEYPEQLLEEVKITVGKQREHFTDSWNEREQKIWNGLGEEALSLEELVRVTGLPLQEIQAGLFQLLLEEQVMEVAKNHFVRHLRTGQ
ncbi:MAG: DNA-processing protein DprA [Lachnospiraceae bacterium]|nr:DNA-processing protein DprA [Lachnospiraceae bacterium]MDY5742520.1 DNA-processing protein DprA [Lachnospiraceae bacterium]